MAELRQKIASEDNDENNQNNILIVETKGEVPNSGIIEITNGKIGNNKIIIVTNIIKNHTRFIPRV